MGVDFLYGVENFHEGEVLFVQSVDNLLHAAKIHFRQLLLELFYKYWYKNFQKLPIMKNSRPNL